MYKAMELKSPTQTARRSTNVAVNLERCFASRTSPSGSHIDNGGPSFTGSTTRRDVATPLFLSATAATLDAEADKGAELRRLEENETATVVVATHAPSSTEPSAETEYALPSPPFPFRWHTRTHRLVIYSGVPRPGLPQLPTAAGNPMVSILSATLPTSSRFPPLVQFQPAAAKRPLVVAKARPGDGPTTMSMRPSVTMDSDAKRPWWSPIFGIGRSGRADSKNPTPDRGDEGEGRSNRSRLTAEKARLLRRKLRAMDSWHDAMYHSAIASRLACADHL